MCSSTNIAINESHLSVLSHVPFSNKIQIQFVIIQQSIEYDYKKLDAFINSAGHSLNDIYDFIVKNANLKKLLNKFDYCINLDEAWQEPLPDLNDDFHQIYPDYINEDKKLEQKKKFIKELQIRLEALYLDEAVQIAEKKRRYNEYIAYSHRKIGWSTPVYKVSNNFTIEIKTNFGYGRSSYFLTKLKYKNLNIVPYSDWVEYRYADKFELLKYSQRHDLDNSSWIGSMEYVSSACNLALTNEKAFIKSYIIDECDKMVTVLFIILNSNSFRFYNQRGKIPYYLPKKYFHEETFYTFEELYVDFTLDIHELICQIFNKSSSTNLHYINKIYTDSSRYGYNLIEFRGEKISGALEFIEEMLTLREVCNVDSFIQKILLYNKTLQPILKKEITLIENKLEDKKSRLEVMKVIYCELHLYRKLYLSRKEQLREMLIQEYGEAYNAQNDFDFIKDYPGLKSIYDIFITRFPEYESCMNQMENFFKCYVGLSDQVKSLISVKDNINRYIERIETFFSKESNFQVSNIVQCD
jgi:hypothetical protein